MPLATKRRRHPEQEQEEKEEKEEEEEEEEEVRLVSPIVIDCDPAYPSLLLPPLLLPSVIKSVIY